MAFLLNDQDQNKICSQCNPLNDPTLWAQLRPKSNCPVSLFYMNEDQRSLINNSINKMIQSYILEVKEEIIYDIKNNLNINGPYSYNTAASGIVIVDNNNNNISDDNINDNNNTPEDLSNIIHRYIYDPNYSWKLSGEPDRPKVCLGCSSSFYKTATFCLYCKLNLGSMEVMRDRYNPKDNSMIFQTYDHKTQNYDYTNSVKSGKFTKSNKNINSMKFIDNKNVDKKLSKHILSPYLGDPAFESTQIILLKKYGELLGLEGSEEPGSEVFKYFMYDLADAGATLSARKRASLFAEDIFLSKWVKLLGAFHESKNYCEMIFEYFVNMGGDNLVRNYRNISSESQLQWFLGPGSLHIGNDFIDILIGAIVKALVRECLTDRNLISETQLESFTLDDLISWIDNSENDLNFENMIHFFFKIILVYRINKGAIRSNDYEAFQAARVSSILPLLFSFHHTEYCKLVIQNIFDIHYFVSEEVRNEMMHSLFVYSQSGADFTYEGLDGIVEITNLAEQNVRTSNTKTGIIAASILADFQPQIKEAVQGIYTLFIL